MRPNEKLYKERYEFFMQQIDPDYILRMYDDCEFSEYRRFQGRCEREQKNRNKTFTGIARAMAEQWGDK